MTEWRRLLFYQIELLLHFFNTQLKRCSLGPMINAVSLVPCGHSLCKSCHTQNKDQNSQTGDRCYCKQQTTAAIANYSVRDGVGKLPAICAFCNLEGSMETYFWKWVEQKNEISTEPLSLMIKTITKEYGINSFCSVMKKYIENVNEEKLRSL